MALNVLLKSDQLGNASGRLFFQEKASDHRVPDDAPDIGFCVDRVKASAQFPFALGFGMFSYFGATRLRRPQMIGDKFADKCWRLRSVPVHRRDLCLCQPNEAVAGFQRVIEECEFVIARQRR